MTSLAFGAQHPMVANRLNNLGTAWQHKGQTEYAISVYKRALHVNLKAFGEKHVSVANCYFNIGFAWVQLGACDSAINAFEACVAILPVYDSHYLGVHQQIAIAANARGMQFCSLKQYSLALKYLHKSLTSAEMLDKWPTSLYFYNNIGFISKNLQDFEQGMLYLEKGIEKANEIYLSLDTSNFPELILQGNEVKKLSRLMKFHKLGCLSALGRKKEVKEFSAELHLEAIEAKDDHIIQALKREGWIKE